MNTKICTLLRMTAAFGVLLCLTALASAQATRTWVSGVGDDANPCSRTAPCKTFAGAIAKTSTGGEIDVLDPGGFGALTITKSISIESEGVVAGVLVAGTNGITIAAAATDRVVLRGLTFEGLQCNTNVGGSGGCTSSPGLVGLSIISAGNVTVENCFINGFANQGINVSTSANVEVRIKDTVVRNNAMEGIRVVPTGGTATVVCDRVRSENNLTGFQARDNSQMTVSNSVAFGNSNNGIVSLSASGGAAMVNVFSSVVTNNGSAANTGGIISSGSAATLRMSGSIVADNNAGLINAGGGAIISWGNNYVNGNNGADGAPTSTITAK